MSSPEIERDIENLAQKKAMFDYSRGLTPFEKSVIERHIKNGCIVCTLSMLPWHRYLSELKKGTVDKDSPKP